MNPLRALVDDRESYGPAVIRRFVAALPHVSTFIDIGAGSGRDIRAVLAAHPMAHPVAIDANPRGALASLAEMHVLDVERDRLPAADGSVDMVMANQVLEHCKEVFWIFHEVSRVLKPGGHFIFGVPNIASLHNRLLLLAGVQPTQHKLASAHVRPFSKRDTMRFLDACWPAGYVLEDFAGAQFYPLPRAAARVAAGLWPTAAFSIFFKLRKVGAYDGQFLAYPKRENLETNFWLGSETPHRQNDADIGERVAEEHDGRTRIARQPFVHADS